MISAFYRFISHSSSLPIPQFNKPLTWYSSNDMNLEFKHKKLYQTSDIYEALRSVTKLPQGVCFIISELANHSFVYAVENCIFPFCASYAAYGYQNKSHFLQNMKDTLDQRFHIINTYDNGIDYKQFTDHRISHIGGKCKSDFRIKQRGYKLIDMFGDIVVVGYEEWIHQESWYYFLSPIFEMNHSNTKKQNPILFVHAHVVRPFDQNIEFTKNTTTDLVTWNENKMLDEEAITQWVDYVKKESLITEVTNVIQILNRMDAQTLLRDSNWVLSQALETHFNAQELTMKSIEQKVEDEVLTNAQQRFKEYFSMIDKFRSKHAVYYDKIRGNGYDDLEMMLCFDEDVLSNEIEMKKMHIKYFMKKIIQFEQDSEHFKNWIFSIKMNDYYPRLA
eukprot:839092_1